MLIKALNFIKQFKFALSIVVTLVVLVSLSLNTPGVSGSSTYTLSHTPTGDTYVYKRSPSVNYGNEASLFVQNEAVRGGEKIGYLKFNINQTDPITQAVLAIYVANAGSGSFVTTSSNTTWLEGSVTYVTKPVADGGVSVSLPTTISGQTVYVDVTSLVGTSNLLTLVLQSTGLEPWQFNTKESATNTPSLLVTYSSSGTPTPTPTLTPTPSPTTTPTPIFTPTPTPTPPATAGFYYPSPGQSIESQSQKTPAEVGLDETIISDLAGSASRWALWRHGYLVNVSGDFNQNQEVKSLRKTWHALTVGAAIKQGKIPDYNQKLSVWETDLTGNDADATWRHVITQSSSFDYPGCGDETDYLPGERWTYSDINLLRLNNALAKAYGKIDYTDNYNDVLSQAYFDAIGMQGWGARVKSDGIRLTLDLEDMGRLGLLMASGGNWNGAEVIPSWYVSEQSTKQTAGMSVNYSGCNGGTYPVQLGLNNQDFPESPYSYLTWVNTNQDFYPGASSDWAWGMGAGGFYVLWNQQNGLVYAGVKVEESISTNGVPHILEANITGPNPLVQ